MVSCLASVMLALVFAAVPGSRAQDVGDLRLVGSDFAVGGPSGRLEVFLRGEWGTVCSNGFSLTDGDIVCRQLGFTSAGRVGSVDALGFSPGSNDTEVWLDRVACAPADVSLLACGHGAIGDHFCTHPQDVAVQCVVAREGDLRLVDSFSTNLPAGRLEIYLRGEWGTVCSNGFGFDDADVACRQLGFAAATRVGTVSQLGFTAVSSTSTHIWLNGVVCGTNDTTLLSCSYGGIGAQTCTHSNDVALVCANASVIEGIENGELRLVGPSPAEGRLEIFLRGEWGTVCQTRFGYEEGDTACRQLGFSRASQVGSVWALGFSSARSSRPVWLSNVDCTADDTTLLSCGHSTIGSVTCSYSQDVGVVCTNNSTTYAIPEGTLRLVNPLSSTNNATGRLEVFFHGVWGTVCDDSFNFPEARVACRQLGFAFAVDTHNVGYFNFPILGSSIPIWLDDVSCDSGDLTLLSCRHRGIGDHNCGHYEDVAVSCSDVVPTASTVPTVPSVGDLRLVGPSADRGRLEIYLQGEWGTVCDDGFGSTEAIIACRQLGFLSASRFGSVISLGLNISPANYSTSIWLDDVICTPTSGSLLGCSHRGIGRHNCGHTEDVALICSNDNDVTGFITYPTPNGELRLINDFSTDVPGVGRLEIFLRGEWGTVCDDGFGKLEADVACRQLGFPSSESYGAASYEPQFHSEEAPPYSRIWLDDVVCSESDTILLTCQHSGIGVQNCYHHEDVGLLCSGANVPNSVSSSVSRNVGGLVAGLVVSVLFVLLCLVPIAIACVYICSKRRRKKGNKRAYYVAGSSEGATEERVTLGEPTLPEAASHPASHGHGDDTVLNKGSPEHPSSPSSTATTTPPSTHDVVSLVTTDDTPLIPAS